jgi:aminoglycoside phosphotransferase (APT) family kinase protein
MTPGLDLEKLRGYLDVEHPGFADGHMSAEVIAGGKSNLTYLVRTDDGRSWVLRRPPLGHVLATAHDMAREYRVMTAVGPTAVPVPHTHFLCSASDVLGAPFYVMENVDGMVYRSSRETADLSPERAIGISEALIDVLADLHDVDPAGVGLADFGRPDGFLERQLRRWNKQLDSSRSRALPGIDELFSALAADIPASGPAAIVHGDYRLDNVIIGVDDQVAAVLDWEMATLGDPLTDLGLFIVYWDGMVNVPSRSLTTAVNPSVGFPSGSELMDRYADRRSARHRNVDLSRLNWYVAFGYVKLAVIAEGIYYRYQAGQTVGAGFEQMGDIVLPLVELGRSALQTAP